ncbi:hypothetical protein [Methanosphaera sp.]|uniref:hypothetical protein n=1 Tax=Methanosphaera sp. TaxID=2666342 RepID=UPI0025D58CD3|nr:hypothetical protein [Methanosphaera sp.]
MSFQNIRQLAKGTATITVEGVSEEVKLLTVRQRETYDGMVNEGFGTVRTNLGRNSQQEANMNIKKVTEASNRADHYLIQCSYPEEEITEESIDELYSIYPVLVKELKRVNGIIDTDDEAVINALQNKTENEIKKQ